MLDLRPLLEKFEWATTNLVLEEIKHFHLDEFLTSGSTVVVNVKERELEKNRAEHPYLGEFDPPDQSLWIAAKNFGGVVLTDDGALLAHCIQTGVSAFRLPTFLIFLVREAFIKKREVYRCLRHWELGGHYSRGDLKKWKAALREVR
ncbi:MAG: hypothetical protein ACTSU5_02065 [Promethearchaeota archaeon]